MISKFSKDPLLDDYLGIGGGAVSGGVGGAATGRGRESGGAAVGVQSNAIKGAVTTMQGLMADLGKQLGNAQSAERAIQKLKEDGKKTNIGVPDVVNMARQFGLTASKSSYTNSPIDGVWGSGTKGALTLIQKLLGMADLQNEILIQPGTGETPYKEMKEDTLLQMANDNINNLVRLFPIVGLSTTVPGVQGNANFVVLDMVGPDLTEEGTEDPFANWGSHPVMVGNVANIYSFYQLIQHLNYRSFSVCLPLGKEASEYGAWSDDSIQKMASAILESTIFKLGQARGSATGTSPEQVAAAQAGTAAGTAEHAAAANPAPTPGAVAPAPTDGRYEAPTTPVAATAPKEERQEGPCVNQFTDMIRWFSDRADQIFAQMLEASRVPRPNPRPDKLGKRITDNDLGAAQYYQKAMDKIQGEWDSIKDDVIGLIKDQKREARPVVTLRMLKDANKAAGRSGRDRERSGDRGDDSSTMSGRDRRYGDEKGPIQRFMYLDRFKDQAPAEITTLAGLSRGRKAPTLDLDTWGSDWVSLAESVDGTSRSEQYQKFGDWAEAVKAVLNALYNKWASVKRDDQKIRLQYDNLRDWTSAINSTVSFYDRNFKEEYNRIRGIGAKPEPYQSVRR